MARLKSRSLFIPGGLKFYQPQIRWSSQAGWSFDTIVNNLISARKANPAYVQQYGWATDYDTVANEVDSFNAGICLQMGWLNYINAAVGEPVAPKPMPLSLSQSARNVAAGADTLVEWIKSGAEAVPGELATNRAGICVHCPENGRGDWTRWFTVPVSQAIRHELNKRQDMNLSTPHDEHLGVCEVCSCPLPLKVHVPIALIKDRIPEDIRQRLPDHCWIKKESAA